MNKQKVKVILVNLAEQNFTPNNSRETKFPTFIENTCKSQSHFFFRDFRNIVFIVQKAVLET